MRTRSRLLIALFDSRLAQRFLWPILERREFLWFVTLDGWLYIVQDDDDLMQQFPVRWDQTNEE
jgi:hypothetical protein